MNAFENFSPNAKVWIYHVSRQLKAEELNELNEALTNFCTHWTAHNQLLKAGFKIVYNQIVVLCVDESLSLASGCSIDKSVHFLKEIGSKFNVNFFDKMYLGFIKENALNSVHINDIQKYYNEAFINNETLFFNYNISTLKELDLWQIPLSKHWIFNRIN